MQIFRKQQQYIWSLIGGKYFLIWNNPFIVYSILIQNMGNIGKGLSLLLAVILAVSSLIMIESAYAQSYPVIIATPTPTPYVSSAPRPTPTSNIALSYGEVSRETVNDDTQVVLAVNAYYNFGDSVTLDFQDFVLNIITNITHGIPPVVFEEHSGNARPIETGIVTVGSTNRDANFSLTFQFHTMQDTFYGEIKEFTSYEVVYTGNLYPSSTSASPTPTPTVPEFPSWTTLLLITTMVTAAGLLVYHKKQPRQKTA